MKNVLFLIAAAVLPWATSARAATNDYPTKDRVEYVLACARDSGIESYESIYKCSCVIDAIAARLSYDEYVEESTDANALSIGGERGEAVRAYEHGKEQAKKFRQIQAEARKGCFLK
jgi:hypothetical protein